MDVAPLFFGVSWVFLLSVKETLIGWRGSFVGKKRKVAWLMWARKGRKLGELPPSACCGPFGKKGIGGPSMTFRGTTKILSPFFCTLL